MKRYKYPNPFDALNDEDFQKLNELEQSQELNFLKAVEILELDPLVDFRFADLSYVDFSNSDLTGFDFTGAKLDGCNFESAKLPKGVVAVLGKVRAYGSQTQERILRSLEVLSVNGRLFEAQNSKTQATRFLKLSRGSNGPLNSLLESAMGDSFVALEGITELNMRRGMASLFGFGLAPIVDVQVDLSESNADLIETVGPLAEVLERAAEIRDAKLEVWDLEDFIDITGL